MPGAPTHRPPIRPERVRRIEGSFAFVPHRFLREGFFAALTKNELALYLFLVLAADRAGISFYGYDRICSTLELDPDDYLDARNGLLDLDLIAFDGSRFQVLSLPERPSRAARPELATPEDRELRDPATVRQLVSRSLADARRK
jgi:hypothetical protein